MFLTMPEEKQRSEREEEEEGEGEWRKTASRTDKNTFSQPAGTWYFNATLLLLVCSLCIVNCLYVRRTQFSYVLQSLEQISYKSLNLAIYSRWQSKNNSNNDTWQ